MRPRTPAERIEIAKARAEVARARMRARHEEREQLVYLEVLERELAVEPAANAPEEKPRKPTKALDLRDEGAPKDDVADAETRKLAREFNLAIPMRGRKAS
jgi:hypothetical protein